MKIAKACRQCRIGKRKCIETDSGVACTPCIKRGLGCSLALRPRGRPVSILPPPSAANIVNESEDSFLDLSTTLMLVKLYLERIHDKPHTLFHPPSLLLAVEQGTIARHVLYGILSLVSR